MAAMYYWSGEAWLPISTGGGSDSAHIVSDTEPTGVASVGDLWIQPNGTAPPGSPGEGEPGPQGEPGIAATIEVAETLTIDAGLPAEVVNVGNENKAQFSFKIPRGQDGTDGQDGAPGVDGATGADGAVGPQGEQGQQGIQGPPGLGIRYVGTVDAQGDLPATATQGDLYVVSTPEPARGFVWDDATSSWKDSGPVQGPQGVPGPQGVKGDTGPQGVPGKDGADGMTQADADLRYVNVAGDSMTGTLTVPSTVAAFQFGATTYNVFGASGGVAVRSSNTNITTFTGASITNTVPLVTPGTGNGVVFGAGGAALNRGSVQGKIATTGMIELPTTAPAVGEAVRRDYVDGRVIAQAAGGSAPAVTGLNNGTLWVEY